MSKARNQYKDPSGTSSKSKPKKKKRTRKLKWPKGISRFISDERTHRITGLALLLTSVGLLIAFTSYFFTWEYDQAIVTGHSWFDLLVSSEPSLDVQNWGGALGAVIAHRFMFDWFGASSFVFVLLFFLAGFRILFKISLVHFRKAIPHVLFALLWLPPLFTTFLGDTGTFLGGSYGFNIHEWMTAVLGNVGAGFMVLFVVAVYAIVFLNLSMAWLQPVLGKKESEEEAESTASADNESLQAEVSEPESYSAPEVTAKEVVSEPVQQPEENSVSLLEPEPAEPTPTMPLEVESAAPVNGSPVATEPEPAIDEPSVELSTEVPEKTEAEHPEVVDELDQALEEAVAKKEEVAEEVETAEAEGNQAVQEFGEYDPTLDLADFQMPTIDLLKDYGDKDLSVNREELETNKNRIVETLANYNIKIAKIKATIGPTVTLYEIVPAAGVRISKIKNLEDDIALSLSALGIRIIAPIPGRGTIGIEVPNQNPEIVSMRAVASSEKFLNTDMGLPIAMGKTISNDTYVVDLAKMPHLLMAGATGQGKSVGLNVILASLLYRKHPAQVKFVLVDPKKVELTLFNKIERHYLAKLPDSEEAIITDTKKVVNTVNSLCIEMDQRYELLKEAQTRNIKEYNAKFIARRLNPEKGHRYLPYIVLVVDEFADLIMTAGKEVETPIARLAQLARAIGIHLIIATQRPSVNIITGTIKANFPSRIAFRVTSKIDSRTILDTGGADQLIGRGDMLLSTGSELIRLQCAFVDTPEIERITEFIGNQRAYPDAFLLPEYVDESSSGPGDLDESERDTLFEDAARIVVLHQQGSASLLQRKLKLGYNRAGRIIDQLEVAGIIGPFEGSKARQVLVPDELSLEQLLNTQGQEM